MIIWQQVINSPKFKHRLQIPNLAKNQDFCLFETVSFYASTHTRRIYLSVGSPYASLRPAYGWEQATRFGGVLILYFFFSWERISITSHTIFRAALALLCFSMFSGWKSEKRLAWGRATASPRGSDTLQLPPCRGKSVKCIFYSGESLLLFCISQYQLGFHKQII